MHLRIIRKMSTWHQFCPTLRADLEWNGMYWLIPRLNVLNLQKRREATLALYVHVPCIYPKITINQSWNIYPSPIATSNALWQNELNKILLSLMDLNNKLSNGVKYNSYKYSVILFFDLNFVLISILTCILTLCAFLP